MTAISGATSSVIALALDLDLEGLDQRVREQIRTHPLHFRSRRVRIRRNHLEVDEPAHPGVLDREPELLQRASNCLALRVEDPRFRPDQDRHLHRTISGSAR